MESITNPAGVFNAPSETPIQSVSSTPTARVAAPNKDLLKVGLFSPVDLTALDAFNDAPMQLKGAANSLIAATEVLPRNPYGNFGRFDFGHGAESARNAHAAIRICRIALDFLEADLLASSESESYEHRQQILLMEKWAPEKPRAAKAEDAYWELMERLDLVGLTYDEFLEIMAQETGADGEVKA